MVRIERSKKSTNQHVKGIEKGVASKPHLCIYMHMGRCSICGRGEMAGVMKGKAWGLGILMMVVVLGVWEVRMASAAVSAAKCKEERRLGINACKAVVYGKSPTPACCHRMRVTHLGCVCSVITPKLAALVDVNRMIELVKGCGRRLPRHYKCGSITFP